MLKWTQWSKVKKLLTVIKISVDNIFDESLCCGMPSIWLIHFNILKISCSWVDHIENSFTCYDNWKSVFVCWNLSLNDFNFSILVAWNSLRSVTLVEVGVNCRTNCQLCRLAVEQNMRGSPAVFSIVSTDCEMKNITPTVNDLLWKDLKRDVPCWSKRWYHIL